MNLQPHLDFIAVTVKSVGHSSVGSAGNDVIIAIRRVGADVPIHPQCSRCLRRGR